VTGLSGTGWNCDPVAVTCTRSDALAAGASYPAVTLTGQVRLFSPPFSFTNTATVSGGGEVNTANDTAEVTAVTFTAGSLTVPTTITTVPPGLQIKVDDVQMTAPHTFYNWIPGAMHTITVVSPQPSPFQPGVQYVFVNWSDGGPLLHNITVPATPASFTAIFKTP